MKTLIKKLLREGLVDTYATYQGKKPYNERKDDLINSINSFTDITDDKIKEIVDYFGGEGHNTDEDAIEDLTEKINDYKKFKNPVTLYRVVAVKNKKIINTKDLGEHFTPYRWIIDGDFLGHIGMENWEDDWIPYIMEVSAPLSEIDVWQTIIQNLSFPREMEVNIKNKGRGVKLIKVSKYYK